MAPLVTVVGGFPCEKGVPTGRSQEDNCADALQSASRQCEIRRDVPATAAALQRDIETGLKSFLLRAVVVGAGKLVVRVSDGGV